MSKAIVSRLSSLLGDKILETSDHLGDEEVVVAPTAWRETAETLKTDEQLSMKHFTDLTAIDWPERDGARFDVVLMVRNVETAQRVRVRTRVDEGKELASLQGVYAGANWAEREVYDMFGIRFADHPDMRRILLYEEFEGHPLRKDYPIDRAQPLVPYREEGDIGKLAPFGIEEGQPFSRIDWAARLEGGDRQVSPSIAVQQRQMRSLSDSEVAEALQKKLAAQKAAAAESPAESGE